MKECYILEMKKSLLSGKFGLAIIMVFFSWCLGLTNTGGERDWFMRFIRIQGTTATMYLTLIFSGLSGTTGFCENYEHRYYQQIIQRKGLRAYAFGQMTAVISTAFITCLTGSVLFVFITKSFMAEPTDEMVQGLMESLCLGEISVKYYMIVPILQCFLDAVLAAITCCGAMAVAVWIPHKFTVFCMPMIIFWVELTLAVYVLQLPDTFNWDSVFLLFASNSKSILELAEKLLFNIVFWFGIFGALFYCKLKERYQNE